MRGSGIMLRRLNDALPGLVLGIIVYGAAVFLAGIWFVPDKLRFTTGLAIGIALACGMAVNMAVVLRDAVIPWQDEQGILYVGVEQFLTDPSLLGE